jgi:hypothetical protein
MFSSSIIVLAALLFLISMGKLDTTSLFLMRMGISLWRRPAGL